jgi:serine protease
VISTVRRLVLGAVAATLVIGSSVVPAAAHGARVSVPSDARIRAAGGRLVAVTRSGGRTRFDVVRAPRGHERETALELARRDDIVAVVVDRTARIDAWPESGSPNDPYYAAYQGDLPQINATGAWATTRGAGATVAVLDTGANLAHPDLAGLHVVGTYNAFDGTANVADGHGHGTHTLGTVAAQTNNGIGVAGVAPDVNVLVVKVLDDGGSGSFSGVATGMEWAIAHGATVITMSLGASGTPDQFAGFEYAAIDAYDAGVTVVAAAGNTGDSRLHFPSCWSHVLSIASVGPSSVRSSFSTMNACNDLAAPGENTLSTSRTGDYVMMSGTSMATPHVAGVIGLVQSVVPGIRPDAVASALETTAWDQGDSGRDDLYGYGLVNAGRALVAAAGGTPPHPPPTPTPAPTPVVLPAKVTRLSASPTTISYDANGYCPTAARTTTIAAVTAVATSTNATAASVSLSYLAPGATTPASVAMTRGATTTAGTTWTAALSTSTPGLAVAGAVTYWVTARNANASGVRYPDGTGVARVSIAVCPNTAPAITYVVADRSTVATNPLGTGTIPVGFATRAVVTAAATDTDGVASAALTVSGAGLSEAATLPMTLSGGTWTATIDPSSLRAQGGSLATKVAVTDRLGKVASRSGPTLTVVRADTAGSAAVTSIEGAADNRPVVTVTADDPDATFTATRSTLTVAVRWSASYRAATGVTTVVPLSTVTAAYVSGRTWRAFLPATWLTTAVTDVRITATPVATDPYAKTTTGATVTASVLPRGAPTVLTASASTTAVYTDPLGTGNVADLGGIARSVTFTARVADSDAVTRVVVTYTAPGVTGTITLPMTLVDGTWTATLTPSTAGIPGTGTIAWKVAATDALGLTGSRAGTAVAVMRADTAGTASIAGAMAEPANTTIVGIDADDADAAFPTPTTATLRVTLRWSATYVTSTGAHAASGTGTAVYLGEKHWLVRLATAGWLGVAGSGAFTLTPVATDPYGKITTGDTRFVTVRAFGG